MPHLLEPLQCSLKQACEWIAFGWEPLEFHAAKLRELKFDKIKYDHEMLLAKHELAIALQNNKIKSLKYNVQPYETQTIQTTSDVWISDDFTTLTIQYDSDTGLEKDWPHPYLDFGELKSIFQHKNNDDITQTHQSKGGKAKDEKLNKPWREYCYKFYDTKIKENPKLNPTDVKKAILATYDTESYKKDFSETDLNNIGNYKPAERTIYNWLLTYEKSKS